MINKKNLLGKEPAELGDKDAIHVAIVAVRAATPINPGQKCSINEFGEAVSDNGRGVGVADPFLKQAIAKGQSFWLLLNGTEVPNVKHTWEHPKIAFGPPTREVKLNKTLLANAEDLGLTYQQLMDACQKCVDTNSPVEYEGTKTAEELSEDVFVDSYEIWSEWCEETGYDDFPDYGTDCCPEIEYPNALFTFES